MSCCSLHVSHCFWLRFRRVGRRREAVAMSLNRGSVAAMVEFTFVPAPALLGTLRWGYAEQAAEFAACRRFGGVLVVRPSISPLVFCPCGPYMRAFFPPSAHCGRACAINRVRTSPRNGALSEIHPITMSENFSAIMIVGRAVFPRTIEGITDASTTLRLFTPLTWQCESTTAAGFSSVPIMHVPTGWAVLHVPVAALFASHS